MCSSDLVEVDQLVETGDLDPDEVMTPCVFVDLIVESEKKDESA